MTVYRLTIEEICEILKIAGFGKAGPSRKPRDFGFAVDDSGRRVSYHCSLPGAHKLANRKHRLYYDALRAALPPSVKLRIRPNGIHIERPAGRIDP